MERVEDWVQPIFNEAVKDQFPADWWFLYWKNHPMSLRRQILGVVDAGEEALYEAFRQVVPEHNGWRWVKHDGTEVVFAQPTEPGFWADLPHEALKAMHVALVAQFNGPLPNSASGTSEISPDTSEPESLETDQAPMDSLSPGPTSEAS